MRRLPERPLEPRNASHALDMRFKWMKRMDLVRGTCVAGSIALLTACQRARSLAAARCGGCAAVSTTRERWSAACPYAERRQLRRRSKMTTRQHTGSVICVSRAIATAASGCLLTLRSGSCAARRGPRTIRTWTGLTDDRIRNLERSYMSQGTH